MSPAIHAGVRAAGSSKWSCRYTRDGWSSETNEPCRGVDGRDKSGYDGSNATILALVVVNHGRTMIEYPPDMADHTKTAVNDRGYNRRLIH